MHVINLCTKCKINLSHTRTVVRECCKGDDQSLWEMGKFDPPPLKNPSTDGHQICVGDYVGDIYHQAKFYPNRFRGFRFCAYVISRPSAQSDSAIFGGCVLEKGYSRNVRTNLTQNTSNDAVLRGIRARKCSLGVAKPISKVWTPHFPKNAIFEPHFDGTSIFFRPKTALTLYSP